MWPQDHLGSGGGLRLTFPVWPRGWFQRGLRGSSGVAESVSTGRQHDMYKPVPLESSPCQDWHLHLNTSLLNSGTGCSGFFQFWQIKDLVYKSVTLLLCYITGLVVFVLLYLVLLKLLTLWRCALCGWFGIQYWIRRTVLFRCKNENIPFLP